MAKDIDDFEKMSIEEFESLTDDLIDGEITFDDGDDDPNNDPEPIENNDTQDPTNTVDDDQNKLDDNITEPTEPVTENTNNNTESQTAVDNKDEITTSGENIDNPDGEKVEGTTPDIANANLNTTTPDPVTDQAKEEGTDKKEPEVPEEYKKAKEFYDALVQAEFTANGQKAKVIMDPEKIIQMHQYGYGFHEKNREFNKYRPILKTLEQQGLMDNPDKLNYAFELLGHNKDAVKKLVKESGLDVLDYDPEEEVKFTPQNHIVNSSEVIIDEIFDTARQNGIEQKVTSALERFDDKSIETFIEDPMVRADMMDHMKNGIYEEVVAKVQEMDVYDTTGGFRSAPFVNRYATAFNIIQEQYAGQQKQQEQANMMQQIEAEKAQVEAEKAKIAQEREAAAYTAQATQKQAEIDAQRRAAAVSTTAANVTKPVVDNGNKFNPLKSGYGEFDEFIDKFLSGEVEL